MTTLYAACSNCTEKIQPNKYAFNGYIHTRTGLDSCHTISSARATLGIQVWEDDDNVLRIAGTVDSAEALDAAKRYYKEINGTEPAGLNVAVYSFQLDWTDNEHEGEKIKIVRVPDAIDLDGYTPVLSYDWN